MPDTLLQNLPARTTPAATDVLHAVRDAATTPADVKIELSVLLASAIFTEAAQDVVGAMIAAAGGSYNDAAGTITLPSGGGGIDAETARDVIGAAMVAGAGVTITPNDGADTITIALDATLVALAGLTGAGVVTATGTDTFVMRAIGAAASTDIPDRAAADARYQALDATLTALAAVTVAANKLIYATGADAFATADLTAFGRSLIAAADIAALRALIGIDKKELPFGYQGPIADGQVIGLIPIGEAMTFPAALTGTGLSSVARTAVNATGVLTFLYRASATAGSTTTMAVATFAAGKEAVFSGGGAVTAVAAGQIEIVATTAGDLADKLVSVNIFGTRA